MKKFSILFLLLVMGLMGCSNDETQNYSFTSMSDKWEGTIQIEESRINSENEEIAVLKAEYTGNNSETLADETITISVIETGGSISREYEGLPEDGELEFDLSNSNLLGKLKTYDQLEVQISWQENDEGITESLFFEYNEE